MNIEFFKYHGAGNDFVMIDSRTLAESVFSEGVVKKLCDRHFGIGADGLILLLNDKNTDFRMKYFNSDGREGTMCGNGGRCIASFAHRLGIISKKAVFSGIDGMHEAFICDKLNVSLKMSDVSKIKLLEDGYFLDTGSPHFVIFRDDISTIDVFREGREIRYQDRFSPGGTNVNFIRMLKDDELDVRTYERGVEDETLACGTGAVASAISAYLYKNTDKNSYLLHARGGNLNVSFNTDGKEKFSNIWLKGPAEFVFKGNIQVS